MNKKQVLTITLIALLLATLATACSSVLGPSPSYKEKREALSICQRCGWTGVESVNSTPLAWEMKWEVYCTRVRDGNSEIVLIETVIAECPAIMQETLEAMPDE